MLPSKCRSRTIASPLAPLYLDMVRKGFATISSAGG
jgi:hypothetical protein